MQGHQAILSVTLWKGCIVAITDDGTIWVWRKAYGEWSWKRMDYIDEF